MSYEFCNEFCSQRNTYLKYTKSQQSDEFSESCYSWIKRILPMDELSKEWVI